MSSHDDASEVAEFRWIQANGPLDAACVWLCCSRWQMLAEDGGFEPPRACTQHAFQACAIGH